MFAYRRGNQGMYLNITLCFYIAINVVYINTQKYIFSVILCTFESFSGFNKLEIESYMCFKCILVKYVKSTSYLSVAHQLFLFTRAIAVVAPHRQLIFVANHLHDIM